MPIDKEPRCPFKRPIEIDKIFYVPLVVGGEKKSVIGKEEVIDVERRCRLFITTNEALICRQIEDSAKTIHDDDKEEQGGRVVLSKSPRDFKFPSSFAINNDGRVVVDDIQPLIHSLTCFENPLLFEKAQLFHIWSSIDI